MARKRNLLPPLIIVLAVILAILVAVAIFLRVTEPSVEPTDPTVTDAPTEPPTDPPTEPPTEPPVVKVSTATIGAVGDLLMHDGVRNSAYNKANDTFDFSYLFQYLAPYLSKIDYAAANLETTLCGLDNGYPYNGYPNFNCTDSLVDAAKNAGFDMLLTANNHSYDTGHVGFLRTLQVIRDKGLATLGTHLPEDEKNYVVRDINGIRIGMLCYTYNTSQTDAGVISLNGITLSAEDSKLVNSFNPNRLDSFYAKLEKELAEMKAAGVEATVVYIHWGEEYALSPNKTQTKIAQKLCDLGVDVIIGGHAHVIQPVELLTGTTDTAHKTLCLYSTGNIVSNQRKTNVLASGHTEDGVLFSVTFAKYSDGTVVIESADLLPTWVNMHTDSSGNRRYDILPLDSSVADWQTVLGISSATQKLCRESYDRTMALVGSGMTAANNYFRANQEQVEAAIGVTKP